MLSFKDHVKRAVTERSLNGAMNKLAEGGAGTSSAQTGSMRSLDAASLTLRAGTHADVRASLFSKFSDALDAFRHRDILVVAICPDRDE